MKVTERFPSLKMLLFWSNDDHADVSFTPPKHSLIQFVLHSYDPKKLPSRNGDPSYSNALKTIFCLKMASTSTLSFQTRCEEVWLDPKNIPSKHQTSGGMTGRLGQHQTHTISKFFEAPWSFGLVLRFRFNRRLASSGVVLFVAGCFQESIVQVTPQGTEPRRGRKWRGEQFIHSSATVR